MIGDNFNCMRQSHLFTKTQKHAPADEVSTNAQLLIRAGFVHKEMAGVYAFLPLGWRVMQKIMAIIREEMNALGAQELFLTALQRKELWERTDRWRDDAVDVWFKTALKNGTDLGLGFTHEEAITAAMRPFVASWRDLPFSAYQFQTKFRNETRAKSGIMRSREFIMKDLYSFSRTQEEHDAFYVRAKDAYTRIFERVGIGAHTYVTFASGGTFSKYSHEFQTVCDAGEDIIYIAKDKGIAINEEVCTDAVLADLGVKRADLVKAKAAEVGNIFSLGTKFSDALDLRYRDENGDTHTVVMGSYGIGPARVMGVVTELFADSKGLVWPASIAPFAVHLINIGRADDAQALYDRLRDDGVEVLWDDRDVRPGVKFADADLMGCPWRVVISERLDDGIVEVTPRDGSADSTLLGYDALLARVRTAGVNS